MFSFVLLFTLLNNANAQEINIYYPQSKDVNITIPCFNNNTYCSTNAKCNLTITYSNDSMLVVNKPMLNSKGIFSYVVYANQTGTKGIYKEYMICNDGASNGYTANLFYITGKGTEPANASLTIFIYILFLASIIISIVYMILVIAKFTIMNLSINDVLISFSSVILFFVTIYLAETYLINTYVEYLTNLFFNITIWSNLVLPLTLFAIQLIINPLRNKGVQ